MFAQIRTALTRPITIPTNAMITRSKATASSQSVPANSDLKVEHDLKNSEFFIQLGKDRAFLQYVKSKAGQIDYVETVVPDSCGGRGIGKILAKSAFDYAVQNNLKMNLVCTFLQSYHEKYGSAYNKSVL